VLADRLLGDAQSFGDLALVQLLDEVEQDNVALAVGQDLVDDGTDFGPDGAGPLGTPVADLDVPRVLMPETILDGEPPPGLRRKGGLPEVRIELGDG